MVNKVAYHNNFEKKFKKIDPSFKDEIKTQIIKIINNPEIGKPMRYVRKGTREVYIGPFRLSYKYEKKANTIVILAFYHKDEQ